MARRRRRQHAPAPAALRGPWLPRSSPAWLRRGAAALLRLLGGSAHAGPQVPSGGRQGGGAGEGSCPAGAVPDSSVIQAAPRNELHEACDAASKKTSSAYDAATKKTSSVCGAATKKTSSVCDAATKKTSSACDAATKKTSSVCDAATKKTSSVCDAATKKTHSSEGLQEDARMELPRLEESENSSYTLLQHGSSSPPWESVKMRKGKWKAIPNAHIPQIPKVNHCTYCKKDGHRAKDCPGWKNMVIGCDQIGKDRPTRIKHKEDNFNLDRLFAEDEVEEDSETRAHRMYPSKVSECKTGYILCLACYLKGKECDVLDKDEAIRFHFRKKHGIPGFICVKMGCLARAETKRDIGLHQYICHRI